VLPYIKKAQEAGWAVIVLNPNLNEGTINGKRVPIARNESPEAHYLYVWDTFVSKAQAKHVLMVSHSYGGVSTINLIEKRGTPHPHDHGAYSTFQDRRAIA
jgi:hypothetical protein